MSIFIPTRHKTSAVVVVGIVIFLSCIYHLIFSDVDAGWSSHDVMIVIFGVMSAEIAFSDPVRAMIRAWRNKST